MRLLTSISIGAFAGAVATAAQPSLQTVYTKGAAEHDENAPTPTAALELRNADAAATTIVAPPPFKVTLCPQPTGLPAARFRTVAGSLYGCQPGYVCNLPKPEGCNFWPGPPPSDFHCPPEFCIVAPPFHLPEWNGKPGYLPPQFGYFNLNPEDFGLSYDIFEYSVVRKASGGHTSTYTTGNWESQSTLTNGPVQTPPPSYRKRYSPTKPQDHRRAIKHSKRDDTLPSGCLDKCQAAYNIVQQDGMIPALCEPGSDFENALANCITCIATGLNIPDDQVKSHLNQTFQDNLFFCDGDGTTPTQSTTSGPESQVTTTPTLGTSSQVSASDTSFIDSTTSSSVQSTTKQSTTAPPPPPPTTSSTTSSSSPPPPPPTSSSQPPSSTPPTSSSSPPPPPTSSTSSSSTPPPASSTPPPASSTPPPASSTPSSSPPSSPPPSSSASSAGSASGSASSSAPTSGSASSETGTASNSASSETGSTSASASSSASASNGASATGPSASSPTTGETGAGSSSTGTNSPTGAGSSTGAGSPSGTAAGTGTAVGTGTGGSTAETGTGTGSPTGGATGTEPPSVTGSATETGTNGSTGSTSPPTGFSSPGQLERASSTAAGNNGGGAGGAGPTGSPGGGGNPGGSGAGSGGATGTGPITSPTSGLPVSNDLSRASENFGLLIAALMGLLVV